MSKKMMKRSLALSALMAFVITGSAMAHDKYDGTDPQLKVEGTVTTLNSLQEATIVKTDSNASGIHGYGTVNYDGKIYVETGNNAIFGEGGKLTINSNELEIKVVPVGDEANGLFLGHYSWEDEGSTTPNEIQVNANTVKIDVNGHGINTGGAPNSSVVINEKGNASALVTIKAGENGVYTYDQYKYNHLDPSGAAIEINAKDVNISTSYAGNDNMKGYAINAASKDSTIDINATGTVDLDGVNGGVKAANGSTVNVSGSTVDIYSKANNTVAVHAINGSNVNVDGTTINITAEEVKGGYTAAVKADNQKGNEFALNSQSNVVIGSENTNSINITAKSKNSEVTGIWATKKGAGSDSGNFDKGTNIIVNGGTLTVNVEGKCVDYGEDEYAPVGIWAASNNDKTPIGDKQSKIDIKTENTIINATATNEPGKAVAIMALSKGVVNINTGNVYATADEGKGNVIVARGGAVVNVGAKDKETVLNGNINFNYSGTVKSAVDASVKAIFDGENSSFNGKIYADSNVVPAPAEAEKVTGMDISFTNGAKWNLSGNSIVNQATFGEGSVLNLVNGSEYTSAAYALTGAGGANDTLTVKKGALLQIGGMKEVTYNVAENFDKYDINGWNAIADNALMKVTFNDFAKDGVLKATLEADAKAMENSGAAPVGSGDMLQDLIKTGSNEETKAAYEFVKKVTSNGGDVLASNNALSNALQMAEAGGNSGTAVTIANNVSSTTTGRMGFSGGEKGGHGVGLLAEDSGAAIWAQYVHGKDRVEDMPMSGGATSYEGQFNGVVMGVDFKKVGKFQSGVAFNYGEGDTNSFGNAISTRSDYDFWGVGYYGNIRNEDTNFIFDINYAKSDSDVEQVNGGTTLEASPETTTWSAGVKVEKLYQNNNVQIVPYTGLRFMSVDTDSYKATNGTDTLFNYAPERQDIWLLPLGVSIKQEVANANGWVVTPKVDLSYIWAFGDTDSEMTVAIPGVSSTSRLGYTVMDDESWLGVVGMEAAKGDWTFGVSYSYQKGDHSENEKWYVDAKYSF